MAQYIKNANIWGRIGSGVGQGLAEQLPKEIERSRLQSGLSDLEGQQDLTPFQQFSRLSAIPGITPQMVQSGSELLRQQGVTKGLQNMGNKPQVQESPLSQYSNSSQAPTAEKQGVTTPEGTRATIENYIPKDRNGILSRAAELQKENPQLYNNPQDAINGAVQEDASKQAQSQALQAQRNSQQNVQDRVENQLGQQQKTLGAKVPGNVFEEIRQEALDDVRKGATEEEATRKAGKKLDEISRQYQALETVGNLDYIIRDKADIKRNLKEIREDFKKRKDLRNLASEYISKNGLSPGKAYYLAYPPSEIKELNNELVKAPDIKKERSRIMHTSNKSFEEIDNQIRDDSIKIYERLANSMGKDGSPLAIAEELKAKNYDVDEWFNYLSKNRNKLDLTERQADELTKPKNTFPTLNDNWLFYSSGLEKLVEQ